MPISWGIVSNYFRSTIARKYHWVGDSHRAIADEGRKG